jgi:hypothetical protein
MADTTFTNGVTLTDADWFNDLNRLHYTIFGDPATALVAAQALKLHKHGADVASAATIDLGAATGDLVDVTGTTTITAITLAEGEMRTVRFTGILTLTNGASLVLPSAANITTAAGDYAIFRGYAAGVVRCVVYNRLDGTSLVPTDHTGYSGKNAVINGDMGIWQRNTSFATIANAAYDADRWAYGKSGAMVHTVSRSTDVPTVAQAGRLFNYSMLVDCTTADAAMAAGDLCYVYQPIEGYNWARFAQRALTLSFWVKATKTGIYCISLRNSGVDKCYVAEYTISAADTWEKKTVSISASPSAGTWDYTTGVGAYLGFCIACGSTKGSGTNNTWNASDQIATANQVIGTDSTSNDFRLCGIQLEVGTTATEFEHLTFQQQFMLCQRYYSKTFSYATAPADNAADYGSTCRLEVQRSAANMYMHHYFPVEMRITPTIAFYNPTAGTAGRINFNAATDDTGAPTATNASAKGLMIGISTATPTLGQAYVHLTANAEL